jgi:hypothetical protein
MSLDHFGRFQANRFETVHLETLSRMANAAGFATASHDDLNGADLNGPDLNGEDDAVQSPFLKARTLRIAQIPDAPAPRSPTANALVVIEPLWRSQAVAAAPQPWSNAAWLAPAQSALRGLSTMFGRASVPA